MQSDFMFSLNVVMPLFLCCVVGQICRRLGLVGERFLKDCTNVVFYIAIPAKVFLSINAENLSSSFSLPLMAFLFTAIIVLSLLMFLLIPRFVPDRPKAAAMAVTMFRGNFGMLGIPLAVSLMGTEGAVPTMVMIPFATVFYTPITVMILVLMGGEKAGDARTAFIKSVREVITNPLVVASVASIVLAVVNLPLPGFVTTTIERFADTCTGLALFMLGAQMDMGAVLRRLKFTVPATLIRLVVIPGVIIALAALLGFRGGEMACVLIFFAAPSAVNGYILCERMGGDGKLAADIVLATSCFSAVTLTVSIFILKSLQLL